MPAHLGVRIHSIGGVGNQISGVSNIRLALRPGGTPVLELHGGTALTRLSPAFRFDVLPVKRSSPLARLPVRRFHVATKTAPGQALTRLNLRSHLLQLTVFIITGITNIRIAARPNLDARKVGLSQPLTRLSIWPMEAPRKNARSEPRTRIGLRLLPETIGGAFRVTAILLSLRQTVQIRKNIGALAETHVGLRGPSDARKSVASITNVRLTLRGTAQYAIAGVIAAVANLQIALRQIVVAGKTSLSEPRLSLGLRTFPDTLKNALSWPRAALALRSIQQSVSPNVREGVAFVMLSMRNVSETIKASTGNAASSIAIVPQQLTHRLQEAVAAVKVALRTTFRQITPWVKEGVSSRSIATRGTVQAHKIASARLQNALLMRLFGTQPSPPGGSAQRTRGAIRVVRTLIGRLKR